MASISAVVGSQVGLHARPAALIAQALNDFDAKVTLATDKKGPVDARSTMMIITLGAKCGDTVIIESDDEAAAQAVATLIAQDLDA